MPPGEAVRQRKKKGEGENPDILRVAGILVLKFRSRLLCPPPPLSLFLSWLVDEREECQKKTRSFLFILPDTQTWRKLVRSKRFQLNA